MFNTKHITGWSLSVLVISHCLIATFAYPQTQQIAPQYRQQQQQLAAPANNAGYQGGQDANTYRKFAVKPNASKKVALDELNDDEDVDSNQIQADNGLGSFSWSTMLGSLMQMFFQGAANAPTKSDDLDTVGGFGGSPWANVISVGLKIVTTLLGGGAPADGIDKVDNGNSPMQGILAAVLSSMLGARNPDQVNTMAKQAGEFINIVMNLLDALKTSFSHRSLAARSIGKRDSVSDAAVASISMMKGYVRSYRNADDPCLQKYVCEANTECVKEIGGSSIFCQLGTYATSFLIGRTKGTQFDSLYDAGRRGRSGTDCRQLYLECNEI